MSRINIDKITNATDNGPVELSEGATIPSGKKISCAGNMNVVGILSVTSLSGSNTSRLTNLPFVTLGKVISIALIVR